MEKEFTLQRGRLFSRPIAIFRLQRSAQRISICRCPWQIHLDYDLIISKYVINIWSAPFILSHLASAWYALRKSVQGKSTQSILKGYLKSSRPAFSWSHFAPGEAVGGKIGWKYHNLVNTIPKKYLRKSYFYIIVL